MLLLLERNGYLEETYFNAQFIPLRGDSGQVEGFYNVPTETTARVLFERRRRVVDRVAAIPSLPVDETLSMIVEALRMNMHDIPVALLYSYDDLAPAGATNLRLRGRIGVPKGHRSTPLEANLETGHDGLVPWFRHVKSTGKLHVLSVTDDRFRDLIDGMEWCGYGEPSREIVVCPLAIGGNLLGFYVQGTNPRRAYDEAIESGIVDITRQMQMTWIDAITTQQAQLREQMLERRATDSENRLRHMAQNAPLGMVQSSFTDE